jgi:hypothetical protein
MLHADLEHHLRNIDNVHVLREKGEKKFGITTTNVKKAKYRKKINYGLLNGTLLWDSAFFSTTGSNGNFLMIDDPKKEQEMNIESAKKEFFRQLKSWVIKDGKLTGKISGANDDSVMSLGIFLLFSKKVEKSEIDNPYYVYKTLCENN